MNFSSVDTSSSERAKAFQIPLPRLDQVSACRRAVTSISIRIRGSASPAEIIMAGGRPPPRLTSRAASAACGVGRSLHREFLITLGCVSSREQPGCCLDVDGLHQYAFLPIG